MKSTSNFLASTLVLSGLVALTQAPQSAHAFIIDLTTPSVVNTTGPESFPSDPSYTNLTISNPATFGTPLPTTFNTNSAGLCSWASSGGPGLERCGYGEVGQGIEGFKFKFDEPTTIKSFMLAPGAGVQNIASATVGFSYDGVTYYDSPTFSDANAGSVISLASPFVVPANTEIFVRTSASLTAGSAGGVVRISSLDAVPGPLPILGAAGAFGWSKRLRKRILTAALS